MILSNTKVGANTFFLPHLYNHPEFCLTSYVGHYWHEKDNRRAYFDTFAQTRGFNPSEASSWRAITTEMVQSDKV